MSEISYFDTNIPSGINLSAEVTIDWFNLGEYFARQASDFQADFLVGMCTELESMGFIDLAMQRHYIAKQLKESGSMEVVRDILFSFVCDLDAEIGDK